MLTIFIITTLMLMLCVSKMSGTIYARLDGAPNSLKFNMPIDRDIFLIGKVYNIQSASSGLPVVEWVETYGGSWYDWGFSVVQTGDGGYALAGMHEEDFWLVRTDSAGNMEWNKTYDGGGVNEYARVVIQTSDGGYALAGYSDSSGAGWEDFWLVKTDEDGNTQWNKTYGGINYDWGFSVCETVDGGYALAGQTYSFGVGLGDFWLVKTDVVGNVEWNMTYGGSGDECAYSIIQTTDGSYALAGRTTLSGSDTSYWDFWLIKIDSSGNVQWQKTYSGPNCDCAYSVVQTVDGGYALAGQTYSFGVGLGDFWLVKTDADGNIQWNITCGSVNDECAYSICKTIDDGFALAGITGSFGAGYSDALLIKISVQDTIPGDINNDGVVDIVDATQIGLFWLQMVPPAPANVDINDDGVIDILDATLIGLNWLKRS